MLTAIVVACTSTGGAPAPTSIRSMPLTTAVPDASHVIVSPTPTAVATDSPGPSPTPVPTANAVAIEGGCGQTPLYAGPGPNEVPGLSSNPWAVPSPATAGIVAYFWGLAPYLAASPTRPHGESNKVLWLGAGLTSVVGHRLDDPTITADLSFPDGAGPSSIDLPSAGCWRLDLRRDDRSLGSIDLAVAPAVARVATPLAICPVTKPMKLFRAPPPAPATPPAAYQSAWYGTAHLWTMLRRDGEVWDAAGLPTSPNGAIGQKLFWWSADWKLDDEPMPAITVSAVRLDGGGGTVGVSGGTNAMADFGAAMLVGVDFPFPGCWQVTAKYRNASLTHVVWIKP